MKTVVITGSARGFGFQMIKLFREAEFNVVLCDISKEAVKTSFEMMTKGVMYEN